MPHWAPEIAVIERVVIKGFRGHEELDVLRSRAAVPSWLAWHDEPGRQLHEALEHELLEPGSPIVDRFMAWFRALFQV